MVPVVELLFGARAVMQVMPSLLLLEPVTTHGQLASGPVVAGMPDGKANGLGSAASQLVQSIQLAQTFAFPTLTSFAKGTIDTCTSPAVEEAFCRIVRS
jgi:hypothetical protein